MVEISAVERVSIGIGLIAADGNGIDVVVLGKITNGVRVDQSACNGARIVAVNLFEFSHRLVDEHLALMRSVSHRKAGHDVPIPTPTLLTFIRKTASRG